MARSPLQVMLRGCCLTIIIFHITMAQDVRLQKIADAYSSWAAPYNPHISPPNVRTYTHLVTVQSPSAAQPNPPIPLRESSQFHPPQLSAKPKFLHVPVIQREPPVQRVQPPPQPQPIQPQYGQSHIGLPQTLRYPNATFLIPQKIRKPLITEEDETRRLAGTKQKWGRPTFEFTCEFGYCSGGCCPSPPPQPTQIHAAALPGSNLPHPVMVILHPSPSQSCVPACQPMCNQQCVSRVQYSGMPLAMPEFFHQQPTCRFDCMPSCHVDCLILPPMIVRCTSFPCRCGAGYSQCTPFSCCSAYMNMRSKFRSMVEEKSEEIEAPKKRKKLRTPLHIPFHGTTGKTTISEDITQISEIKPKITITTALNTTVSPPTISSTTPSTTTSTTTTTTIAPPTTTSIQTTTPMRWIKPIYPEIPLVPVYELWQPREKIIKAQQEEEETNFIRSNSFVEMLAELAQVKAKEDLDMTAEDFLKYLTETGK